uniref:Uncharacterized protein n=1 Tax=Anopheles culicifacies TaxID=139723 RepID=A0A182LYM4_9DIPT
MMGLEQEVHIEMMGLEQEHHTAAMGAKEPEHRSTVLGRRTSARVSVASVALLLAWCAVRLRRSGRNSVASGWRTERLLLLLLLLLRRSILAGRASARVSVTVSISISTMSTESSRALTPEAGSTVRLGRSRRSTERLATTIGVTTASITIAITTPASSTARRCTVA